MNYTVLLAYILALALSATAAALTSGGYDDFDIDWWTIDGGGVMLSSGGDFELSGTIGQPDAGVMTGGDFTITGGFWAGSPPPGEPCPADVNDDGKVNIDDLFQILGAWGTCDECPEDINDDGKVNIDDLFIILGQWGPCP
ncbi:MAG: hypothetical protein JSV91_04480 [Phycisphaerales bacterium]|nr:MAG: hypothetical protein JSV91_04480 [Phycisphaerales bacterium]